MLPDDQKIMIAFNQGDEQMFENVFKHYYSLLCAYAAGILNDYDEAEDIVQQTMVKVWEKRSEIEITTSLKSYLYRSVHNASINRIKHAGIRNKYADDFKAQNNMYAVSSSSIVQVNELDKAIANAISKLPEQCRLVFKLSRFEELKYSEIAEQLGISVKTVENHMGKALKLMRLNLKEFLTALMFFLMNNII